MPNERKQRMEKGFSNVRLRMEQPLEGRKGKEQQQQTKKQSRWEEPMERGGKKKGEKQEIENRESES